MKRFWSFVLLLIQLSSFTLMPVLPSYARSGMTPWETPDNGYRNLVYGASSPWDVQQSIGSPPDEIVRLGQVFPVIENHYYFDTEGSGSATIFVFENGLLAGMHLKTPSNQLTDLTYFLVNNGDRRLNSPNLGGYQWYTPYFPMNHGAFSL